jgi:hypothetical protein
MTHYEKKMAEMADSIRYMMRELERVEQELRYEADEAVTPELMEQVLLMYNEWAEDANYEMRDSATVVPKDDIHDFIASFLPVKPKTAQI